MSVWWPAGVRLRTLKTRSKQWQRATSAVVHCCNYFHSVRRKQTCQRRFKHTDLLNVNCSFPGQGGTCIYANAGHWFQLKLPSADSTAVWPAAHLTGKFGTRYLRCFNLHRSAAFSANHFANHLLHFMPLVTFWINKCHPWLLMPVLLCKGSCCWSPAFHAFYDPDITLTKRFH